MDATEESITVKWALDPAHSELTFKVKHLMISNVKGEFRRFSAETDIGDGDFSKSTITVSIDAASIFTNEEQRDAHLRSAEFFDVEKYPTLTFKSTSFRPVSDDDYKLKGILTIKGISREIALDAEFGGINKDLAGNEKAGFSIHGKINRKDFGLNWNAVLESGGVLVSDEVRVFAEVQFIKQAEIPPANM